MEVPMKFEALESSVLSDSLKTVYGRRSTFKACLHGGLGIQVGEVNRLGGVTHLSI